MAAVLTDLSRRGDQGFPIPALFSQVHTLLSTWMAAANAQNPAQLLEVLTGPADDADHPGWTLRATLAASSGGVPVQLMSQWVASLATSSVSHHVGLAGGHDPGGGLGAHGLLGGGEGSTAETLRPEQPLPVLAWVASSLVPGQEFFGFCLSLHTFTNRQAVVLLIAKDITSGQWHLHNTSMNGGVATVAWNAAAQQVAFASGLWSDFFSAPPYMLRRPAVWMLRTPTITYLTPLPPVRRWDAVVLPADFAVTTRSLATGAYAVMANGSEWMVFGPGRLAVRLVDPPSP